jgi:hypothetical protein
VGFKKQFYILFIALLFLQNQSAIAQSQSSVEKRAEQAFAQKNYQAAMIDYRQLLAKDQQNPKFNFCYGVCIYEVEDHFAAAKYFDVILGLKQEVDPLVYYYRARIYQEQYFFKQALSFYEEYQKTAAATKNPLDVNEAIEQCRRADSEIQSFVRLPLLNVTSVQNQKFYSTYKFNTDDYTFYEAPEVHSKNNAKHKHVPVYAYKRGMKYRILASYGAKGEQLDLYLQRKDANNNWGEPEAINGGVNQPNTSESFAFYDPVIQVLYFCSTANSIGGHDLFKASFDLNQNQASSIEKMTYPYSSPSDDLFYVCDAAQNQAYFATSRQGKVGQYEIYTLQLDRPVSPTFVFEGRLLNELNPASKSVSLSFTEQRSQEVYGPFIADEEGAYQIALPLKGEFQMDIRVEGASRIYQTRFSIPSLKPQTTLQQQVRYFSDEMGKEQWQVLNQVIDLDPQTQLASLSKLQMNVARGALVQAKKAVTQETTQETTLAETWGFGTLDTAAFMSKMTDTLLAAEVSLENQVRLMELLRQDFEQQLNTREQLLAKLSRLIEAPSTEIEQAHIIKQLEDVEQALAFDQRWIEINRAANIPDLQLLDTLRAINERNQALILTKDTLALVRAWSEGKEALQQYLQIAAFDGASALDAASVEQQLRLQKIIKEEAALKEQQQQLAQQIKQLQTALPLQTKKEQAQTQLQITALERDQQQLEVVTKQLRTTREAEAAQLKVYDQHSRKEMFVAAAENQSLPEVDMQVSYDEMLAQYAQQEVLSQTLKSQIKSQSTSASKNSETVNLNSVSNEVVNQVSNQVSNQGSNLEGNSVNENSEIANSNRASNQVSNEVSNESLKVVSNEVANPISNESSNVVSNQTSNQGSNLEGNLANGNSETSNSNRASNEVANEVSNESSNVVSNEVSNQTSNQGSNLEGNSANENSETANSNRASNEVSNEVSNESSNVVSNEVANQTSNQGLNSEGNSVNENSETANLNRASNEVSNEVSNESSNVESNQVSNEASNVESNQVSNEASNVVSNEVANQTSNQGLNSEGNSVNENSETANLNRASNEVANEVSNESSNVESNQVSNEASNVVSNAVSNQSSIQESGNEVLLIEAQIARFESQIEAIKELNLDEIPDDLPTIERLGLSNEAMLALDEALTLPKASVAGSTSNEGRVSEFTSEQDIQAYVDYVAKRQTYEQTKAELVQNQAEIRAIETNFDPKQTQQLTNLLTSQATLQKQLKTQKQALLEVPNQLKLEALLAQNYRPDIEKFSLNAKSGNAHFVENAGQTTAFSMQTPAMRAAAVNTPLPIGVPCPEGLVFRVQVGAFRKPVPAERFREFTPVDGKVLANGLTVYMAGYFKSSAEALQQQALIRKIGYADAFVVAYQNCNRLSLAQGRALEKNVTVATGNLAAQRPFADPGQGLYYTVQVGVYNRPLNSEAQLGLTELIEAKTAKGQYRYASGKFDNLKSAKTRQQDAVAKGIKDAFIVAYYQGKRIDLAQAKQLAAAGVVFETNQTNVAQPLISSTLQKQVQALQLPEVKPVTLPDPVCRFERKCEDCSDALSRYNRVGVFIYDVEKECIVSASQKESEWDLVQLMYLKEMRKKTSTIKGDFETIVLDASGLDGAFVDWLLRQQNSYELFKDAEGKHNIKYVLPAQD